MLKRKRTTTAAKKAVKYKKRYKRESLSSLSNNRIHFVRRHVDFFTTSLDPVSGTGLAYNFSLNDVPGYTEFTNLYDQYKICGVHMTFFPKQQLNTTISPIDHAKANARFLMCIDLNDGTAPSTADEVRQYESCQVGSILDRHEIYVKKPLFLNASGQNVSDWVATSSPSLNWFGVKCYAEPNNRTGSEDFTYSIEAVYYLCFKNIK